MGWLAGASSVGKGCDEDAPHLVYIPERPFSVDAFLGDIETLLVRQDWVVVVVAEGLRDAQGDPVYQNSNSSRFDALKRPLIGGVGEFLAGIVAEQLRIRCRSEKPGLLGRASTVHVSEQDLADADMVGRVGVHALALGHSNKMVALLPLSDSVGQQYDLVDLDAVTGVERPIPAELLSEGSMSVNQKFIHYVSGLTGCLAEYFHHSSLQHKSREMGEN